MFHPEYLTMELQFFGWFQKCIIFGEEFQVSYDFEIDIGFMSAKVNQFVII